MNRLPVFQNEGKRAYKPGLDRINNLLARIGNPQQGVTCIHVAGTNGKGTTCNALAATLQSAGYKVGLFTSPHFISMTERIKVNGENANESFVCDFLNKVEWDNEPASYFELLTAMGFEYFHQQKVDVAIIEVGLGGRLDSTNICHPILSVITNVGLDHCDMLGDTIEKIAVEKAGIKKQGIPMVVAPVEKSCKTAILEAYGHEEFYFLNGVASENNNADLLNELVHRLKVSFPKLESIDVKKCVQNMSAITGFQGRFQALQFRGVQFLLDVAHNAPALSGLFSRVEKQYGTNVAYIIGVSSDKDIEPVLASFPKEAMYYPVQASVLRAKKVDEVKNILAGSGLHIDKNFVGSRVSEAVDFVVDRNKFDAVVVTGSFFVVADSLKYFREK
jgi:dihydrofolate synthase/folylpolyglutamate synthase